MSRLKGRINKLKRRVNEAALRQKPSEKIQHCSIEETEAFIRSITEGTLLENVKKNHKLDPNSAVDRMIARELAQIRNDK